MMIFDNKIILLFYFIISYEYWVYCFVENGMCLNERNDPEYFLLSPCHKSTLKSIIEVNVNSLEKCKRIAIRKRGMGINYSPKNLRPDKIKHHSFKTCIIVSCPETENSTSLVYDSRYHYYSMYAFPIRK